MNSTQPARVKKPTLSLKTFQVKPGMPGPQVAPNLKEEHRGKSPAVWSEKLTDEQSTIIEKIAAESSPNNNLTILLAASKHAPSWPISAVCAALRISGHHAHSKKLAAAVFGMRAARFEEVAVQALEHIQNNKARKMALAENAGPA